MHAPSELLKYNIKTPVSITQFNTYERRTNIGVCLSYTCKSQKVSMSDNDTVYTGLRLKKNGDQILYREFTKTAPETRGLEYTKFKCKQSLDANIIPAQEDKDELVNYYHSTGARMRYGKNYKDMLKLLEKMPMKIRNKPLKLSIDRDMLRGSD